MKKTSLQVKFDELSGHVGHNAKRGWKHFHHHGVKRFHKWSGSWRFVVLWILLILVLTLSLVFRGLHHRSNFLASAPVAGGGWREGMVGSIDNLNPLFATSHVDQAVDSIVFNGLLKYDSDESSRLANDLANSVAISKDGLTYTVRLKRGVKWQDGRSFTSADVVYTYKTIQNPEVASPLATGLEGVDISAPDKHTVILKLSAPFAPFENYLTTPILPSHLLSNIAPGQLRSANFNTNLVGTGPFKLVDLETTSDYQQIDFVKNDNYFAGPAKLGSFSIYAYENPSVLTNDFHNHMLTAATLTNEDIASHIDGDDFVQHNVPLYKAGFLFLNTDSSPLSDDGVRRAIGHAIDQSKVIDSSIDGEPLNTILLDDQLGYDKKSAFKPNIKKSKQLLQKSGWKLNKDGLLTKKQKNLTLKLVTSDVGSYPTIANRVASQLKSIGVDVKVNIVKDSKFQQSVIQPRDYDMLIYGVTLGVDPDPYAYWHSSQVASGFNLSEYESSYVDTLLNTARISLDEKLRSAKYIAFQQQILQDTPIVPLYRLTYQYVVRHPAQAGNSFSSETEPSDRFWNVTTWTSRDYMKYRTP